LGSRPIELLAAGILAFAKTETINYLANVLCKIRKHELDMQEALEIFVAVAKRGNFSAVAKDKGVAISSVTRKIAWLETEMGARLFNRGSKNLVLTDVGEEFIPRAQNILAELEEAKEAAAALSVEPRGVLSVAAPATFGRRHVAGAVTCFLKKYPLIQVDLQLSDAMVDVAAERVDVAIRIGVLANSDLLATKLAPQRRVACASPDYLKSAGRPKSPKDLLEHECLTVRTAHSRVGWWTFRNINKGRSLRVRGRLRTDDSDALMQAAIGGLGIAHLATWLVGDEIDAGLLVPIFEEELELSRPSASAIYAIRMQGRADARARLFIDFLKEHFGGTGSRQQPYWDNWLSAGKGTRRR
jgi:DNA-binding transcriptional LysR family regulator